ncbi:hypothetical protein FCM35_KLT08531 [Carex littledalei]|uniref:Uncharacterized protein n=1 Tax=Carex littledalei TaxID=544730 RepID=A0A833QYF5_9POAL|nr:hypothetical protein FCM35_KLT08531 [Carex littledalei]
MDLKISNDGANDSKPFQPKPESQQPNDKQFCSIFEFLPTIFFLYLTYNFGIVTYRSRNNPWDLAFVTSCYVELMLLFYCLRKDENLTADTPTKDSDKLKGVVWVLCTLLTCTFALRISQIMPWYMNIIIWGMSASVILLGFYFFFLIQCEDAQSANKYCKLDTDHKEEKKFCELSAEDKV